MEATTLTSGSSIVVKQYSHHPKVKDSYSVASFDTRSETCQFKQFS